MDEARQHSWEGIVAKDARSTYKPGRRTLEWRKLKLVKRQELVVGGFTEPRGARSHFGALLLGLPTTSGRLRYAGHVGGGFTEKELAHVWRQLAARKTSTSPFDGPLPANEKPHWVRPELVAEVQFAEWTTEGYLRQPVYLGLRDDLVPGSLNIEVKPPDPSDKAVVNAGELSNLPELGKIVARLKRWLRAGSGKLELPDGAVLELGNLAKPLWPALGLTKGNLFRYYLAVSPFLLPVVRDRPLVMKRFPDGIAGNAFYQQRAPDPVPRGVRSERVDIGDDVPARLVGGDLATLLHMVQLAVISQDPWFSRAQSPQEMDCAAIDLDPMAEAPFSRVRDVARWVRDELDALGMPGWLKTSGSRGLHIFLPLRPGTSYESGMLFCQSSPPSSSTSTQRRPPSSGPSTSAIPRPSTSTACRTSSARRWPAPTAPAPATTLGRPRRSTGTSSTTSSIRAPSRSRRSPRASPRWAICGRFTPGAGDRSGGRPRTRPGAQSLTKLSIALW